MTCLASIYDVKIKVNFKVFWKSATRVIPLEYKRIIQQIHQLLPAFDQVDKAKSRMSFRNNSLERYNQSCTMLDESINGSTRDLFFDCEEELFMSGEDSSDEEHTG